MSSTVTTSLRSRPHHQRRHGDAVVVPRFHRSAAGDAARAPPCNDEAVGQFLDVNAVDRQHRADRLDPVALLDPQLGRAGHFRLAISKRRQHRKDRQLVDHRGHQRRIERRCP